MNWIDFIIFIFLLFGLWKGFRRGFLNTLVGFGSLLFAFFVAWQTHSFLAHWLDRRFGWTGKLTQYLTAHLPLTATVGNIEMESFASPETDNLLETPQITGRFKVQLLDFLQKIGEQIGWGPDTCLGDVFYLFLATLILKLVAIIIIWFLVHKGLLLISALLTRLLDDTFWGSCNQMGGLCLGLLIRLLVLTIIIGFASPLLPLAQHMEPSFFSQILQTAAQSFFVPQFAAVFPLLTGKIFLLWI